jgi:ligand-binding sensor domain-containing protein
MRRILQWCFALTLLSFQLHGQTQSMGQWKSFTDMKPVRGAVHADGHIWAVTSGGVFVLDTSSGEMIKYTNTDGIASNDLCCITAEPGKRIWVGGSNGYLSVFDIKKGTWSTIDARAKDRSQVGIQKLFLQGDTMYVATVYGVMPFKINQWEFGDTYTSFGSLSSPTVTCIYTSDEKIYVGTDRGIAIASRKASDLYAPNAWTVYSTIPGIASSSITALTIIKDTLIIATDKGLAYYSNGSFGVISAYSGRAISDLRVDGNRLLVLINEGSGFTVESLSYPLDIPNIFLTNSSYNGSNLVPASSLWVSTTSNGMACKKTSEWSYFYPNGPRSNYFGSLVVDDQGVLWVAPIAASGSGYYKYDPSLVENDKWRNFTGAANYKVSLGVKGSVWVSSFGDGIIEVAGDTVKRKLDYYSVPKLPAAITTDTDFVVASGAAVDADNRVWIINRNEINGRSLIRLNDDGSGTYFDNRYTGYTLDGWFHSLVIDNNGTKWIAGDLPWESKKDITNRYLNGVYLFNENLVLSGITLYGNSSTGYWGHLSSANGLRSDVVLALAVDNEGAVWIGTNSGVTIISDPVYPKQLSTCYPLYGRFVQSIAVDAINNKWIGTNEGVFVVNPDGTELLQTYDVNSTNGRLVDNNVRSIAIDHTRGIAYFGTENGLSSFAIGPMQTVRAYTKLEFGPNPFIIPNGSPLIIRNLVSKSSIKVMTVSGSVVAQFEAQGGGRAFWDGKNKNGVLVPSGIYFIIAYADNGSQSVVGKVAVIRK